MRRTFLLLPAVASMFVIACFSDGDSPKGTPTPSPPVASATRSPPTPTPPPPTPSPSPTPAPLPEPPQSLAGYAEVVAGFLSERQGSEGCPDDLLDAWQLPIASPQRCLQADTNGDGRIELLLVLTPPEAPDEPAPAFDRPVTIAILEQTAGLWRVAYRTPDVADGGGFPISTAADPGDVLMAAQDLNGLPGAEMAYRVDTCGAHTCYTTVKIVGWGGAEYADLTPQEVTNSYADVVLQDRDGDDIIEIVIHGGSIGSVGAGPTRTFTEVYRWDGSYWVLAETVNDPATLLYHAILDADETFEDHEYASAIELYTSALADPALDEWKEGERGELEPYALFRIALSRIALGGDPAQMDLPLRQAVERFPDSLHGGLARAFREAWLAGGNVSAACGAALAFIGENFDAFDEFWYYGYGNPPFDAQALCPF